MRVLLIEDDPAVAKTIKLILQKASFNIEVCHHGEDGINLAKLYDYDLIILDINLPDMSGQKVLRNLRLTKVDTPVIILTGSNDIEDKVIGFGSGADDYLTKPFRREELIARIHAIVRRSRGQAQSIIKTGAIYLNLDKKSVEVEGKSVKLTAKEYQVLEILSLRKGNAVTKEMLLNHLYGGMDEPEPKIIDVFISKLRKKLREATGERNYIETVWGQGYVLRDPTSV